MVSKKVSNPSAQKKSSHNENRRKLLSELSLNQMIDKSMNDVQDMDIDVLEDDTLKITIELLDKMKNENKNLKTFIESQTGLATNVEIFGWSREKVIPSTFYDDLLNSQLKMKTLVLRGRGCWDTCRCPKNPNATPKQLNTIKDEDLTEFERIQISSPFNISSCALLDLVSRSPKLKILRFYGVLKLNDHHEIFKTKEFRSDLERVYWPWCDKKSFSTLTTLIRRNENVSTFYSNAETTCDLIAADALPNLRHLSLILNENWNCKPGYPKKAFRFLQKTAYLAHAKKLEALEVRTFDLTPDENGCQETRIKVERVFEQYKLTLWEQISKLPNLRYLAIFGAWELEKVCRELAKNRLQIELLKINLMPSSVISAIEEHDDCPVLSMAEGIKHLRKLSALRSLHFICYEKLAGIDPITTHAFKELADIIWILDVKTIFTQDVEDLLSILLRRGNQQGKLYKIYLHIESSDAIYANILAEPVLKFSSGKSFRDRLASIAESETAERFGKPSYKNFQLWGIESVENIRDNSGFLQLKSDWDYYNEIFKPSNMYI